MELILRINNKFFIYGDGISKRYIYCDNHNQATIDKMEQKVNFHVNHPSFELIKVTNDIIEGTYER